MATATRTATVTGMTRRPASTASTPSTLSQPMSTTTAIRRFSPRLASRWERWSRPPWDTGRPRRSRATVTTVVSRTGMASSSRGMTKLTGGSTAGLTLMVRMARTKPRNRLPASPMKIDAGGRL